MKFKKAFTLIELLVVIAIIGILTTIAVVALNNARAKARDVKRIANIKQIQTALELFFNDNGRYPTTEEFTSGSIYSTSTNGTTTYMATIPTASNPPDGSCTIDQNTFIYTGASNGATYTINYCLGGAIGSVSLGRNCATESGISGGHCFICGDTIAYAGGPYDSSGLNYSQGGYYRTVQIDNQCWLKDNLNIGTYMASGSNQPDADGGSSTFTKYCYNNNEVNPSPTLNTGGCDTDGGLYQWHAAMALPQSCDTDNTGCAILTPNHQGICPFGWHLPSDSELTTLETYLNSSVGDKIKKALDNPYPGNNGCSTPGNPICGSSNFDGLMVGWFEGGFSGRGQYIFLWSSLPYNTTQAYSRFYYYAYAGINRRGDNSIRAASVRCVKD